MASKHLGVYDRDNALRTRCGASEGVVTFSRQAVDCEYCLMLIHADKHNGPDDLWSDEHQ